jgi:PAS domain S-box-containing protein
MRETLQRLEADFSELRADKALLEQALTAKVNTLAGALRDTERRRLESKRDLRSLLDNMPSLIGYWDRYLRNRFGNQAYAIWFGYDRAQLEGKHLREVIGEALFQLNLPYIEAALRGERQQFERAIPSPDRTQIRHSLAEYIPDIVDGEVLGFYVLVSDITSIKNADYALREAQKLGGVGSFSLNLAGDRWTSSQVLDAIFGIDAAYVRNVNGWVQRVHPDERDELAAYWQQSKEQKTRFERDYRVVRASDGAVRWVHSLGNFIFDQQGTPVQFIGSVQDITERKQSFMDLAKANKAADAANLAKSAFLATMGHELRTPMNGIMGMAQLLQMPGLAEQKRINFAGAIIDSGKALVALIDDILDLANLEGGKLLLQRDLVDPAQLMHEVRAHFSENARTKNLKIACDWNGPAAHYPGDSRRLRQMLSTFVSNALKFTSHGGILIAADELECDERRALLEFSVRDTGVGIAQDKLHLLFQTFSQGDSSSTRIHGGSGVGLSIVRKMAELMGGEVGVESKIGQGSRFWFRVQLERSQ